MQVKDEILIATGEVALEEKVLYPRHATEPDDMSRNFKDIHSVSKPSTTNISSRTRSKVAKLNHKFHKSNTMQQQFLPEAQRSREKSSQKDDRASTQSKSIA